jgi:hypothetical protein
MTAGFSPAVLFWLHSSCAGSTRASIVEKTLFRKMDCRVKPGNDK